MPRPIGRPVLLEETGLPTRYYLRIIERVESALSWQSTDRVRRYLNVVGAKGLRPSSEPEA